MFTLEALDANHGDCIFLHFGTRQNPEFMIIDGGPGRAGSVFATVVRPRLEEMAANLNVALPLDVRLVMVSHIDDDHIGGVLKLMDRANIGANPLINVEALWHNSFDDFLASHELDALASFGNSASAGFDPWTLGLAASVEEGRSLRNKAKALAIEVNAGTSEGFVSTGDAFEIGTLTLKILGPAKAELKSLQSEWDHKNPNAAGLSESQRLRALADFTDESIANLASIVAYVEQHGKTVLLTGDARGDKILEGLRAAHLLTDNNSIKLDILKVPHHGSARNVDIGFFKTVLADHYVFSADGRDENPDTETLEMLVKARGNDHYTMWFTHELPSITTSLEQDRLINHRNYEFKFRASNAKSLVVDLEDPLPY